MGKGGEKRRGEEEGDDGNDDNDTHGKTTKEEQEETEINQKLAEKEKGKHGRMKRRYIFGGDRQRRWKTARIHPGTHDIGENEICRPRNGLFNDI